MQKLDIITTSPETAEKAAKILCEAWETNTIVNIRGGGTKQDLGNIGKPAQLVLSTLKLDKLVAYEPADLTITVQAGMKWATLRETLAEKGQWLPLDPPELEGATVGGVVASNVSGPKRLLYGTLRDLVIGCQFVLADGTIGRSGGRVVKNVSGYDLHKLLIGSLGTLALITELTFKVLPKPGYSAWLVLGFEEYSKALETARKLAGSNLSPAALEVLNGANWQFQQLFGSDARYMLFAAADGVEVAVTRQIEGMVNLAKEQNKKGLNFIREVKEAKVSPVVWQALYNQSTVNPNHNFNVRLGSILTKLPQSWKLAEEISQKLEIPTTLQARAGTGLIYLYDWLPKENIAKTAITLQAVREQIEANGGSLVIEKAPLALKENLDVWGKPAGSNSLSAMQTIKQQLDERNLLNPGKFVGGI